MWGLIIDIGEKHVDLYATHIEQGTDEEIAYSNINVDDISVWRRPGVYKMRITAIKISNVHFMNN